MFVGEMVDESMQFDPKDNCRMCFFFPRITSISITGEVVQPNGFVVRTAVEMCEKIHEVVLS
jgi:hypothetical protein